MSEARNFSGRYSIGQGGFYEVHASKLPEDFKNKRIIIQSLDAEGNALEATSLSDIDKDAVLETLWAIYGPTLYIREKFKGLFTEKELPLLEKMLDLRDILYVADEYVQELRHLLNEHSVEKISFALDISQAYAAFNAHPNNPYFEKTFTFEEALDFIAERSGIYFAIDKHGRKRYDFVDKPTKKQAYYQRTKNGNSVVFLSFTDWKIHTVSNNELSN
jgi:hypothetical protein